MNRIEIESKLSEDRAWLIARYSEMTEQELTEPVTPSEHDPASMWTAKDHLVHLILIENNFNAIVRRHIAGDTDAVTIGGESLGKEQSREKVMASVHAMTERWAREHRNASLEQIVALGQRARAETLTLLSELTQSQLDEVVPGAPWAAGVVGGILAANADHGRMHYRWVREGRERLARS